MEHVEPCEMVSRHDERLKNLEGWQKVQNGTLQRLETKLDKIYIWLIGLMGGVIASLILLVLKK